MTKAARQKSLQKLCSDNGFLSARQAAVTFDVSEMTIRRDFNELADQDKVLRVHGGISSLLDNPALSTHLSYSQKLQLRKSQKQAIARRAAALVRPGDAIFLGPGSTCQEIACLLQSMRLRVVTNNLMVFTVLREVSSIELCVLGGLHCKKNGSLTGTLAEEMISAFGLDRAFVSANGVFKTAISTSNAAEGRIQSRALARSGFCYLVVDSSKLDRLDAYTFFNLERIDTCITDDDATSEQQEDLRRYTKLTIAAAKKSL